MEAAVTLEELTQGKLLQAQVVGRSEDGVPYINVFQIQPNSAVSISNNENAWTNNQNLISFVHADQNATPTNKHTYKWLR